MMTSRGSCVHAFAIHPFAELCSAAAQSFPLNIYEHNVNNSWAWRHIQPHDQNGWEERWQLRHCSDLSLDSVLCAWIKMDALPWIQHLIILDDSRVWKMSLLCVCGEECLLIQSLVKFDSFQLSSSCWWFHMCFCLQIDKCSWSWMLNQSTLSHHVNYLFWLQLKRRTYQDHRVSTIRLRAITLKDIPWQDPGSKSVESWGWVGSLRSELQIWDHESSALNECAYSVW